MQGLPKFEVVGSRDEWSTVAHLVDILGTADFERELFDFAADHAAISVMFAIELNDTVGGRVLLTEGKDEALTGRARIISRDYAENDYAVDEVLLRHHKGPAGAFDMVVQRAEDREADFRTKYFDDVDAAQELSVFNRQHDSTLYMGFSSTVAGFEGQELDQIERIATLMASLIRRHTGMVDDSGSNMQVLRERRLETLRQLLLRHQAGLTPRESDVCAAIVIGYRAEAIGDRLGISANTVATHRKRAYAKLHISSQTELFGIFFSGWTV